MAVSSQPPPHQDPSDQHVSLKRRKKKRKDSRKLKLADFPGTESCLADAQDHPQALQSKESGVAAERLQEEQQKVPEEPKFHDGDEDERETSSLLVLKRKDKKKKKNRKDVAGLKAKRKANDNNSETLQDVKLTVNSRRTLPIEIQPSQNGPLRGMRKWLADYHNKRPGLHVLQQQIDDFIADFEAREEEARKEREAAAAEEGWTVVGHHKGRKKTTDLESGITVGGVASAAVERNAKKKNKDTTLDFYRFQRREARRNEMLELQKRFEEDKKKIVKMRAARKFRPY